MEYLAAVEDNDIETLQRCRPARHSPLLIQAICLAYYGKHAHSLKYFNNTSVEANIFYHTLDALNPKLVSYDRQRFLATGKPTLYLKIIKKRQKMSHEDVVYKLSV